MSITRRSLAEKIAVEHGLSLGDARDLVDEVFGQIACAIADKQSVKLSNFGSFYISQSPERMGRNPMTGEQAKITARYRVTFKPSKTLQSKIGKLKTNSLIEK